MARLRLVLDVDGMTMKDLKQYVHDVDEKLEGEGNGIKPEHVTTVDIVQTLLAEGDKVCRVVDEVQEKTVLQHLGALLNDVVMNPDERHDRRLREINDTVAKVAMHTAGVTASDLADENQENSPRVLHFWTLQSLLLQKVYMSAANDLTYYEELDK
jgi:predicted nucleotidyltransferase